MLPFTCCWTLMHHAQLYAMLGCRWQRADKLGLQPPREVLHILDALQDDDAQLQCLWYGRI